MTRLCHVQTRSPQAPHGRAQRPLGLEAPMPVRWADGLRGGTSQHRPTGSLPPTLPPTHFLQRLLHPLGHLPGHTTALGQQVRGVTALGGQHGSRASTPLAEQAAEKGTPRGEGHPGTARARQARQRVLCYGRPSFGNSQKRMKSGSAWRPPPTVGPVKGLMAASAQETPTDTWQRRPQGKTMCGCDFISSYRARPRRRWAFWVPVGLWAVRPPRAGAPGLPRPCSCLWAVASLPAAPEARARPGGGTVRAGRGLPLCKVTSAIWPVLLPRGSPFSWN